VAAAAAWGAAPLWDLLSLTNGGHVYFRPLFPKDATRLLSFHEDTYGGMSTVIETQTPVGRPIRTLLTNGKFQANDAAESLAQVGFALVPILHARAADSALVIGLGSGQSASVVAQMGFSHIDIAELAPGMVEAADRSFRHVNRGVLHDPRVSLHLEDGRNFLLLSDRAYDVITMEISSVWFAGSTSLYSREFYRLARAHLNRGGLLQQWIQMHHLTLRELGSVIATMREAFPHVSFWLVGGQGILVASEEPQSVQAAPVAKLLGVDAARRPERLQYLAELLRSRLLDEAGVDRLLASAPFAINTDANRFLEYATPRYNLARDDLAAENERLLARWSSLRPADLARDVPAEIASALAAAPRPPGSAQRAEGR
jgi:spermidine synthase